MICTRSSKSSFPSPRGRGTPLLLSSYQRCKRLWRSTNWGYGIVKQSSIRQSCSLQTPRRGFTMVSGRLLSFERTCQRAHLFPPFLSHFTDSRPLLLLSSSKDDGVRPLQIDYRLCGDLQRVCSTYRLSIQHRILALTVRWALSILPFSLFLRPPAHLWFDEFITKEVRGPAPHPPSNLPADEARGNMYCSVGSFSRRRRRRRKQTTTAIYITSMCPSL